MIPQRRTENSSLCSALDDGALSFATLFSQFSSNIQLSFRSIQVARRYCVAMRREGIVYCITSLQFTGVPLSSSTWWFVVARWSRARSELASTPRLLQDVAVRVGAGGRARRGGGSRRLRHSATNNTYHSMENGEWRASEPFPAPAAESHSIHVLVEKSQNDMSTWLGQRYNINCNRVRLLILRDTNSKERYTRLTYSCSQWCLVKSSNVRTRTRTRTRTCVEMFQS